MHIAWVVEESLTLLTFSFFGGVLALLFNINHAAFNSVVWWIALFSIICGPITVMPIVRYGSPYYSLPSRSAWFRVKRLSSSLCFRPRFVQATASSPIRLLAFLYPLDPDLSKWGCYLARYGFPRM
jgi:hypothetical protein